MTPTLSNTIHSTRKDACSWRHVGIGGILGEVLCCPDSNPVETPGVNGSIIDGIKTSAEDAGKDDVNVIQKCYKK